MSKLKINSKIINEIRNQLSVGIKKSRIAKNLGVNLSTFNKWRRFGEDIYNFKNFDEVLPESTRNAVAKDNYPIYMRLHVAILDGEQIFFKEAHSLLTGSTVGAMFLLKSKDRATYDRPADQHLALHQHNTINMENSQIHMMSNKELLQSIQEDLKEMESIPAEFTQMAIENENTKK